MKCEFKQVCRGISLSVQSAAYAAEVSGKLTAQAVAAAEQVDEQLLVACANTDEEAELIRLFVQDGSFNSQKEAAKMAVKSLFEKWSQED